MSEPILQFFKDDFIDHMAIGQKYQELADMLCLLPRNPERTVALRKLLESYVSAKHAEIFVDRN